MLKQIDLAVLGGHFMNDPEINKYEKLIKELLEQYNPSILSDCYIEYQNSLKPELYIYAEQRSKTIESALEIINNESLHSLGYGLSKEKLAKINSALSEVNTFYNKENNIIKKSILKDIVKSRNIISCGNKYLDSTIGIDGFEKGRSYIFASQAKGGKSLFLQNLASMFSRSNSYNNSNYKIIYVSLENDLNDIFKRSLQMENNPKGKYSDYDILYNPKMTLDEIKDISEEYDIVIVDYLARILPPKELERETLYTIYGEIADRLHYIANETDTIIISACQLNRSALSVFKNVKNDMDWLEAFEEIDQDSLSDSMGIVRNSDSVSVVWFKNNEYRVHNIASRVMTKEEACYCSTYGNLQNPTIEMTINGGFYVCSNA